VTEQAANIAAIERYIGGQVPAVTPEAKRVRDRFLSYMAGVSWFEREFEPGVYDRVRNFKLEFNRANATTDAEREAVEAQAIGGLSSEELRGEADRRQTDGTYVPAPTTAQRLMPIALGLGALALVVVMRKR
jgi:hypothetical protein